MKKFITITAALLIGGATLEAHADADTCQAIERIATAVMEARQNGVPMSQLMGVADDNSVMQDMVIEAYNHPAYRTRDVKNRTIRNFADRQYRLCFEVFRAAE